MGARAQPSQSMFVFQNRFWLNLHQFLRGEAYRRSVKAAPGPDPANSQRERSRHLAFSYRSLQRHFQAQHGS
jgi:hypothetical protein